MYHSVDMGFGPVKPPKARPLPPPPPGRASKHARSASTVPGTILPPPMFSIKPISLRSKNKSSSQETTTQTQRLSPKPSSSTNSHVSHKSVSSASIDILGSETVLGRSQQQTHSSKIVRVMGDNPSSSSSLTSPGPENHSIAGPSRPPRIALDTSSIYDDSDDRSRAESPMMFSHPHTVPAFVSRWAIRELDEDRRDQESVDQSAGFELSETAGAEDGSSGSLTAENDEDKVQPEQISTIRPLPVPPSISPVSRPLPKISSIPSLLQPRIDEEDDDDHELDPSRPPSPLIITSPMHTFSRPRTPVSVVTRSSSPTLYESGSSKDESKRRPRRRSYTTMEFLPEFSSVPPSPVFHNFVEADLESQSESSSSPPESAVISRVQQVSVKKETGIERSESPLSLKDAHFHQPHLSTGFASLTLPKRSRSFNLLSGSSNARYHNEISSRPMPKPPVATTSHMSGATGGWTGEWNSDDIQDVIHPLRKLK
jgi:hypothetical protein